MIKAPSENLYKCLYHICIKYAKCMCVCVCGGGGGLGMYEEYVCEGCGLGMYEECVGVYVGVRGGGVFHFI